MRPISFPMDMSPNSASYVASSRAIKILQYLATSDSKLRILYAGWAVFGKKV
jgi:hypothetical protein